MVVGIKLELIKGGWVGEFNPIEPGMDDEGMALFVETGFDEEENKIDVI